MSPEQIEGKEADARSDLFALGAVLYEMATGKRPFEGKNQISLASAILEKDPAPISAVQPLTPPALEHVVSTCLAKNPDDRFQTARDVRLELNWAGEASAQLATQAPVLAQRTAIGFLPWAVAGIIALVVACVATWFVARRPQPATRMQFSLAGSEEMSISHMALSPDGSMLAFVSPEDSTGLPLIYVQRIGSSSAAVLAGTQGASFPFWSPDGANLGFFANGKLQKVAVSGGTPQFLARAMAGRGGTWGKQNVIVYAPDPSSPLWRINADGSGEAQVTQELKAANTWEQTHRWPVFLPDGKRFLYWSGNFANARDDKISGIYLSSLDDKQQKLVLLCRSSFGYDSGHLYYAGDQRQLTSVAFDPVSGQVSGNSTPIAGAVGFQPSTYWAALTVSGNGTVIYNTGVGAALSVLTWVDRAGKELGRIGESAIIANPTLSPDGSRAAVDIADLKASNVDIWLENTNGSDNARFTFDPTEETNAIWSRDGSMVAYRSVTSESTEIMVKRANGLENEKALLRNSGVADDFLPNSWSADGQQLLFTDQGPSHTYLSIVPAAGGERVPLLNSKANETSGQISTDGKWVAYASDESGAWEIYVSSFPGAEGKWQVSRGGGTEPRWRGDGKEIYYLSPGGMMMSVTVNAGGGFSTGAPAPLFQIHGRAPISSTDIFTYDVTRDGSKFLVNHYVKPDQVKPLTILFHAGSNPPGPSER
jgi:Tol biopolymer transport system component